MKKKLKIRLLLMVFFGISITLTSANSQGLVATLEIFQNNDNSYPFCTNITTIGRVTNTSGSTISGIKMYHTEPKVLEHEILQSEYPYTIFNSTGTRFLLTGYFSLQPGETKEFILETMPIGPGGPDHWSFGASTDFGSSTYSNSAEVFVNRIKKVIGSLATPAEEHSSFISDYIDSEYIKPQNLACGDIAPNQVFTIHGELVIDVDYCFKHSTTTIYLTPESKIIIPEGLTLEVLDATIKGCNTLWDAIIVEPGGTLITNNADIKDGLIGVHVKPGGHIIIEDTRFIDNETGIYFEGLKNLTENSSWTLNRNEFYGTGHMNYVEEIIGGYVPEENGQHYPFCGIAIKDMDYFNLEPSYTDSYFNNFLRDMNNGIVATNSTIDLTGCKIEYIKEQEDFIWLDPAFPDDSPIFWENLFPTPRGAGISITKGNLIYSGSGDEIPSNSEINSCDIGILSNRSDIGIINTYTRMNNKGILVKNGLANSVLIDNCLISENKEVALELINNLYWEQNILNSRLGVNSYPDQTSSYGLKVLNNKSIEEYGFNALYMVNTAIKVAPAAKGVYMEASTVANFIDNWVYSVPTNAYFFHGMHILGSNQINLDGNRMFTSQLDGFSENFGIRMDGSYISRLACNEIRDGYETGMRFVGMSDATIMQGNEFNDHLIGFQIGAAFNTSSYTGPQSHHGNLWPDDINIGLGQIGAKNFGINEQIVNKSLFIVDRSDIITPGKTVWPPHDPAGWFKSEPGNTYVCPQNDGGEPPVNVFTDLERAIVEDSLPVAEFPDATAWTGRRHLMFRLLIDDNFLNSRTDLGTFYQSYYNQPEGQFARIEAGIYDLLDLTDTQGNQLQIDKETLKTVLNTRGGVDSIIRSEAILGNPIDGLLAQRQTLSNQIQSIQLNINTQLKSAKNDLFYGRINQLAQENNAINVKEVFEINEQKVNDIYFSALLADDWELSNVDSLLLLGIAEQCAYAGGDAVWRARALYKLIAGEMEFEDDVICAGSPPYRKGLDIISGSLELYPNPANVSINIVNIPANQIESVQVLDINGSQVHYANKKISNEIDISRYSPGIYILNVTLLDKFVYSSKFIKQ